MKSKMNGINIININSIVFMIILLQISRYSVMNMHFQYIFYENH